MAKVYINVEIKLIIDTEDISTAMDEMEYSFNSGDAWDVIDQEMVGYEVFDVK